MNHLSSDCRDHVFSYLQLFDCLRYAETSKASLEQVLLQVQRRRKNQFLVRHVVQDFNFLDYPHFDQNAAIEKPKDHPFLYTLQELETQTCELPSVLERIEGLYRAIPASHPFCNDLKNLIANLKTTLPTDNNQDILQRLSSVTYAHRLHASLLSRCTIHLHPTPYDGREDENSLAVTLDRYLGDVLSTKSFVEHSYDRSNSSGVEGGPSLRRWMDRLTDKKLTAARRWYHYWVFLHSYFLRSVPFSIQRAKQLKLEPISGILEQWNVAQTHENNRGTVAATNQNLREANTDHTDGHWFIPFYSRCSSEAWSRFLDHDVVHGAGHLETTFHHFGPLGPFRGRDRVVTNTMKLSDFYRLWKNLHDYERGWAEWLNGFDECRFLQWMISLQEESRRIRPMTVQPPLVTIQMSVER